jgi:hypothetical protein
MGVSTGLVGAEWGGAVLMSLEHDLRAEEPELRQPAAASR